ncbi:MAG: 30S ribosomal protein S19e [Thermoplasmata archaeon]|nr:MAG: 30S ribosomal protein S19e [Thermoplasmata archaeon]
MTTVYDVPPQKLIDLTAEKLRDYKEIEEPEWARDVKTGTHVETQPVQENWWHIRTAAVLRKIYLYGPIGTERLSGEFGGAKDRKAKPYKAVKGSRSVIRHSLQQLETAGLVEADKNKGRKITPKGQSLLDNTAREIMKDLASADPELSKYY